MKYPMFSIRDAKAAFGIPFFDQSDQTAQRGFAYQINNPDGIMNFTPKDFDLYKVGEFDTETGQVTPIGLPEFLVSGVAVYNEK